MESTRFTVEQVRLEYLQHANRHQFTALIRDAKFHTYHAIAQYNDTGWKDLEECSIDLAAELVAEKLMLDFIKAYKLEGVYNA